LKSQFEREEQLGNTHSHNHMQNIGKGSIFEKKIVKLKEVITVLTKTKWRPCLNIYIP